MSTIHFHPNNCGMRDLVIQSSEPKTVMLEVCAGCVNVKYVSGKRANAFNHIAAHVIFSQAAPKNVKLGHYGSYGDKLANFIEEHKLGTVLRSEAILNPDHGPNYITAYVWTPNTKALEEWWLANKSPDPTPTPKVGQPNYNYSYNSVPMVCPGLPPVKEPKEPKEIKV